MKCRLSSQLPIMSKLGIPLPKKKKKKQVGQWPNLIGQH